jgi:hypothetical protein
MVLKDGLLSQTSLKIVVAQINSYFFQMMSNEDKIYIQIVELEEI